MAEVDVEQHYQVKGFFLFLFFFHLILIFFPFPWFLHFIFTFYFIFIFYKNKKLNTEEENQNQTFHIAIEGCCHGDLDLIYETIEYLEKKNEIKVALLICCGDFQVRFLIFFFCFILSSIYLAKQHFVLRKIEQPTRIKIIIIKSPKGC